MLTPNQLQTFADVAIHRRLKTPYMLTDVAIIREQCQKFKKVMPKIGLYYALKSFSDSEVVLAIDDLVDGYDIASVGEIEQLLSLGIHPDRMNYSNPVKSEAALDRAWKLGIKRFAFQSYNELIKIKKHAPHASVYLRVKVNDAKDAITFSSKFGSNITDAVDLCQKAKALGLKPLGLTFHVGSQATELNAWQHALKQCNKIVSEAADVGIKLDLINLGGGFPVQYNAKDPTIDEVGRHVIKATNELKDKTAKFIAEPGRFLVADSSVIVATVIGVEERDGMDWLFLDVGAFQAFIEIFEFGHFPYPVFSLDHIAGKVPIHGYKNYILTGPSCDSYDTMSFSTNLPNDISLGTKLLITISGAYTVVYGSAFNGFKVPKRYYLNSGAL